MFNQAGRKTQNPGQALHLSTADHPLVGYQPWLNIGSARWLRFGSARTKNDSFKQHVDAAVDGLTPEAAADLLLTILHNDMNAIVERYIAAQRKQIVAAFENWWDKYRVTLTEIEGKRDEAAKALQGFLKDIGYV